MKKPRGYSHVITPDEMKWYGDLQEHFKDPSDPEKTKELNDRATELVALSGHKVNYSNNKALFEVLISDDIKRSSHAPYSIKQRLLICRTI